MENVSQTYPTPPYYIPDSGYPVSTLDHSSIYAYPTPHQNPGPDPFPGQIRPSLSRLPSTSRKFSTRKYKHTDTAPLNNFFPFYLPCSSRWAPAGPDVLPLICPPTHIRDGRTPDRAREPLLNFRKIQNYGKTKKSTHDHQTRTWPQRDLPTLYLPYTHRKLSAHETRILLTLEPTLDHIISSKSQPGEDETSLPYTASHLVSTVSDPPAGESTSRSTKSKLPTLYLPWTALTLACTGADIKFDQDKPAYPRAASSHIIDTAGPRIDPRTDQVQASLPCTVQTHNRHQTRRDSTIEFHQV